jgi:hypothetical protein
MEARKDYVYCKKCQAVIGEESDTALVMKTVYVEDNFTFSCVACHTKNEWKSETVLLREDLAKMSKDYLAVQKEFTDSKLAADQKVLALTKELEATKLALAAELKKPKK